MAYQYNDGGRAAAGFKGDAGDCFTRAVAIATGRPYREVYDAVNRLEPVNGRKRRGLGRSTARGGVYRDDARAYLESLGWVWVPCMSIGSGCKVHVRADELPPGRLILSLSRHYAAFVDGVLHDTYDSARDGTRCVYGYFREGGK